MGSTAGKNPLFFAGYFLGEAKGEYFAKDPQRDFKTSTKGGVHDNQSFLELFTDLGDCAPVGAFVRA